ncbi:MAG: carboxymuconolactone decarboxylase family protein [Burkholderiales bacterium]|jgi:4-carboxymuconolactone decarboxylase
MEADEKGLYDRGMKIRREVLGAEYVDKSVNSADEFQRHFQEYVTKHCWGAVWTRPGLPKKTRSMLNLAMLAATNRSNELKLHLKGAVNNGVTKEEMAEIFLQVGVYCGAPAALESFKVAKEVFAELKI